MRLGAYLFLGLIFIGMVGGGVYLLYPGSHSITLMGITLNLPIAAWVVLPLLLFFLLSILHMVYHGTRGYFKRRRWVRDAEELQDALYWSLIREPKEHLYHMPSMKAGAPLLNVSHLEVVGNIHGLSDKLMKTIEWIKKVENGEYVDLRAQKVERFLSRENPLLVRNLLNRIDSEREFAETVLQNREIYDTKVVEKALDRLVEREDLSRLSKYIPLMSKKHLYALLERIDRKEDVGLTPATAKIFTERLELECPDYIRLMRTTLRRFTPDENLKLFKELSQETEKAQSAYLYLLFEYEMIDQVQKFLEEHDEMEFKPFRALLVLKQGKHNFRIDELLDSEIACRS
jgi:hypothetical protein